MYPCMQESDEHSSEVEDLVTENEASADSEQLSEGEFRVERLIVKRRMVQIYYSVM